MGQPTCEFCLLNPGEACGNIILCKTCKKVRKHVIASGFGNKK